MKLTLQQMRTILESAGWKEYPHHKSSKTWFISPFKHYYTMETAIRTKELADVLFAKITKHGFYAINANGIDLKYAPQMYYHHGIKLKLTLEQAYLYCLNLEEKEREQKEKENQVVQSIEEKRIEDEIKQYEEKLKKKLSNMWKK